MNSEASAESYGSQQEPPDGEGETQPVKSKPARQTSQAERAAMHPEPHEVEWNYYFGAWSH